MPANSGRCPPHDRVDIKLRQGMVIRDIDPKGWRWKEWPEGPHAFDIIVWQVAGALREWSGKKGFTPKPADITDRASTGRTARQ